MTARWPGLILAAASVASCFFSAARQGLLAGAWAYALLLSAIAFVPAWLAWRVLAKLPAAVRLGAAAALAAWLGWSIADKYAVLPIYSKEGVSRGELGALRSAVSIYTADFDGALPKDLNALVPKYLDRVPSAFTRPHGASSAVKTIDSAAYEGGKLPDSGGWAYVVSGPSSGTVVIDCTHADAHGTAYSSY